MPLNASGTLSIGGSTAGQSINLELGRAATASSNLNESSLRTLAGVASGQISISNFYGKSNDITSNYALLCSTRIDGTGATPISKKLSYATASAVTTTSLTQGIGYELAGAGISTFGLFGGGRNGTTRLAYTSKFTYSGNTTANATNLSINRTAPTAFGNSLVGIFLMGQTTVTANRLNPSIYTYSSNTCVTGTASVVTPNTFYAGCSNATYGVFSNGQGTSMRYTFSGNTIATTTAIVNTHYGVASSTTTVGYLWGWGGTGSRYTYSNATVTASVALTNTSTFSAGAGNGTYHVNHEGSGGSNRILSNRYTYSTNTCQSWFTFALNEFAEYSAATSSAIGNF